MRRELISDIEAMLAGPLSLTEMLARVPIDMRKVLDERGADALAVAVAHCRSCRETAACNIWIGQHDEGDGARAPEFCSARDYLAACAPDRTGPDQAF